METRHFMAQVSQLSIKGLTLEPIPRQQNGTLALGRAMKSPLAQILTSYTLEEECYRDELASALQVTSDNPQSVTGRERAV